MGRKGEKRGGERSVARKRRGEDKDGVGSTGGPTASSLVVKLFILVVVDAQHGFLPSNPVRPSPVHIR